MILNLVTPCPTGGGGAALPPNPPDILLFGLANNVYQTKNYIIGASHYTSCFGDEFIRPKDTHETSEAIAHYYRMAKVRHSGP